MLRIKISVRSRAYKSVLEVGDPFRLPKDLLADKDRDFHYGRQDQGQKDGWQDGAECHEDHREGG